MYTLSSFRRRLHAGDTHRDVELVAGTVGWLPAQEHSGENTGESDTHVLFVELKEASRTGRDAAALGPDSRQPPLGGPGSGSRVSGSTPPT